MLSKRSVMVAGTLLAILIFSAAALAISLYNMLLPVDSGAVDQFVMVEIPSGAGTVKIAVILEEEGIIRNALAFRLYARWKGQDTQFIAGVHLLSPSMGLKDVIAKLTNEDVYRETAWFTIPEGFTVEQIADRLAAQGLADRERFLALARQPSENLAGQFSFIGEASVSGVHYTLEGYLFPDTYEIAAGASEEEIIALMLRRLDKLITAGGLEERCRELGLSLHQLLTLASIVEREARLDTERKLIAGVFYNRLSINMKLDSCATVLYALGEIKDILTEKDLQVESPFNTYKYPGLPPGPIAAPGEASIQAAANPETTGYYYFVFKWDGSNGHYFSHTHTEHFYYQNIAEQNWRNRN